MVLTFRTIYRPFGGSDWPENDRPQSTNTSSGASVEIVTPRPTSSDPIVDPPCTSRSQPAIAHDTFEDLRAEMQLVRDLGDLLPDEDDDGLEGEGEGKNDTGYIRSVRVDDNLTDDEKDGEAIEEVSAVILCLEVLAPADSDRLSSK